MASLNDLLDDPDKTRAIEAQFQYYNDQQGEAYKDLQKAYKNLEKAEKKQAKVPDYNKAAYESDIKKYQDQIDSLQNKINNNYRKSEAFRTALNNGKVEIVNTTPLNEHDPEQKYINNYQIVNLETKKASNIIVHSKDITDSGKQEVIQKSEFNVRQSSYSKYTTTALSPEEYALLQENKKAAERLNQKQATAAKTNKQKQTTTTKTNQTDKEKQEKSPISEKEKAKLDKEKEKKTKANTPTKKEEKKASDEKIKNVDTSDLPIPPETKQGFAHSLDVSILFADQQGTEWHIGAYLRYLGIVKQYESAFKPMYKLVFDLPISVIKKIENAKDYKYRVTLSTNSNYEYIIGDKTLTPLSTQGRKMTKVFDLFLLPFHIPPKKINANTEKSLKNKSATAKEAKMEYEVELFDMNHVKSSHIIMSGNYRNVLIKDAIIDLMNKYKNQCFPNVNNLIFCPPDLNDPIETLTFKPDYFANVLKEIHSNFNIYNRALRMFLNEKDLYIYKRSFTPILKDGVMDNVNIIIGDTNGLESEKTLGMYQNIKTTTPEAVVYIASGEPSIDDHSASILNKHGDKVVMKSDTSTCGINSECMGIKDNADPLKSLKYDEGVGSINSAYEGKEKFIVNKNDARYNMDLMIDEAQSEAYNISLRLADVNLGYFKPTTNIYLYFVNPEKETYTGYYYIKELIALYTYDKKLRAISLLMRLNLGRKFTNDGKPQK